MKARIAIVSTIQPETHYTRFLYYGLIKSGVKVKLFVDRIKENEKFIKESNDNNIAMVWNSDFRFPFQLIKMVKKEGIKVLHLQHEFNMYGRINGIFVIPVLLLLLKVSKTNVIVTIHAIPAKKDVNNDFIKMMGIDKICPWENIAKIFFVNFYKLMAKLSSSVIVHSKYTKMVCEHDYMMGDKVATIPIGIAKTTSKSEECRFIKLLSCKKYLLFFGYILERKGLEELISAFAKLDKEIYCDYLLVVAGGLLPGKNRYKQKLLVLCRKFQIEDRVIFTGFITKTEIDYLYRNCLFVVLPYVSSISSSLPLSFAFAYGKTVVVSKIGTLKGEIIEKETGIFCIPGNINSLYKALKMIIVSNKLRINMENNIKKETKKRSWEKIAIKTSKIYQNLIKND